MEARGSNLYFRDVYMQSGRRLGEAGPYPCSSMQHLSWLKLQLVAPALVVAGAMGDMVALAGK